MILTKRWTGCINIRQNHLGKNIRFDIDDESELENFLKNLKDGDKIVINKLDNV